MLRLELQAFDSIKGPRYEYSGSIRNISHGRRADYRIELTDEHSQPLPSAKLERYPRWAEPIAAFVARCIQQVLSSAPPLARPAFRLASLDISLNATPLRSIQAALADGVGYSGGPLGPLPTSAPTPWELIQWCLTYDIWGSLDIPPVPPAVEPPAYYHEGLTYCRLKDLPLEARERCEEWLWGQTVPVVPGVDDAIYPWDMERFLGK